MTVGIQQSPSTSNLTGQNRSPTPFMLQSTQAVKDISWPSSKHYVTASKKGN